MGKPVETRSDKLGRVRGRSWRELAIDKLQQGELDSFFLAAGLDCESQNVWTGLAWPVTALDFFGGRKSALDGGGAGMSKVTDVFV